MLTDGLPPGHTAQRLAAALAGIPGVPEQMITLASRGYYHGFLSPLDTPELQLVAVPEASRPLLDKLTADVIAGEHDASKAESDAWARSPEGRAVIGRLFGPGRAGRDA